MTAVDDHAINFTWRFSDHTHRLVLILIVSVHVYFIIGAALPLALGCGMMMHRHVTTDWYRALDIHIIL